MVDYTIANQIRPFQLPDIAGIAGAMQGLELNRMRSQQLQGAEQERNAVRQLMATPGFDVSSPDAANRLLAVAPTTGAAMFQALQAGQRERRQAQVADLERGAKFTAQYMDMLSSATPENYAAIRAAAVRDVPNWAPAWPEQYSPDAVRRLQSRAADSLKQYQLTVTASPAGGFVASPQALPYGAAPMQGPQYISPENIPAVSVPSGPPAAPAPGRRAEGTAMTPGQTAARSQSTDPLLIDAAIRRNEGTARNPASSAVGPYQFIDSTFVDQFRRSFPDVARTLSPEQILTFRGSRTPDGRSVEEVMGPALTAQNQQALTQAGIAPTAGNTYLAHFLGAGGARAVLRADPNTPISELVSRDAIAANPTILGVPGVTAGQIVQWANGTIDVGPREARRLLTSGSANAMPGAAAPANAMLAPQDATASNMPQFPVLGPAPDLATADRNKRIMDIVADLEKKRIEAERRRAEQPERVEEARQTAGATSRAQAEVRGSLPPPPAGYRYNSDFTAIEPITGSPQARAETERREAQVSAANVVTRDIDRILERLNTAVLPVTGFGAPTMTALVGGSPAADVAELRKTIEGNISFDKINEMRRQSPTGGALGNVTDKDMELLKTSLGSLSQTQSPRQFRENLLNLRENFMRVIHGENWREIAPPPPQEPAPERLPGRRGPPRATAPAAPAEGGWSIRPVQ